MKINRSFWRVQGTFFQKGSLAAGGKIAVIFLIFLVSLAVRLYKLDDKSAWTDESKQAGLASIPPYNFNMAERASMQQQPPLDYFFEAIFIENFGFEETGIRLHAALFGALSVVFFFLLVSRILDNLWAVLLGTAAFAFHPLLIQYSQEGRPISTAVFFGLLYLYFLVKFFQIGRMNHVDDVKEVKPEEQVGEVGKTGKDGQVEEAGYGKKNLARPFALLTIVQLGFLLSAGFQPIIFLLTASLCLLPHLVIKKSWRLVLLAYLSSALALLLSLPIIYMTISTGSRAHFVKHDSIIDMIKNVSRGIDHLTIGNLLQYHQAILENYGLFFIVVVVAGIIGFFLSNKKPGFYFFGSFFIMFFLIYPPVFTIIFKSLISWKLHTRYYLTFAPVCFMVMTMALYFSFELIGRIAAFSKPLQYAVVLLLGVIFAYSFGRNSMTAWAFYQEKKPEWNKMYDIFKYESEPGDIAYMMSLVSIDRFSPDFRVADLYYPGDEGCPVSLRHGKYIPFDLRDSKLWENPRNVYLAVRYGSGKIRRSFFEGMDGIEVLYFKNLSLIRVKKSPSTKMNFEMVLRTLLARLPRNESNYFLYQVLIALDIENGNLGEARGNLEALKSMDKRKRLKKLILGFTKQLRGKNFKNLPGT